jgi:hypothetical protein
MHFALLRPIYGRRFKIMQKEEITILKHISDTLDRLFEFISKPPSKWSKISSSALAIVGILGIIAIVDVILSWIKG